jgi:hypothetical protein
MSEPQLPARTLPASSYYRFEMTFGPTMVLILTVRQFISSFYDRLLGREAGEMVSMVTHELLENALKYSAEDSATLRVEVIPESSGDRIVIQIRNRSSDQHIRPLKALIDSMNQYPDPMEHYIALMRETSKRKDGSGLGLARMRAEAGMELDLKLDGSDVCLTAQCLIERSS